MGEQKQSHSDLENHFKEHIGFLTASCEAFDRGFKAEAKRMACSLRVLLHDTKNSKSLLKQIHQKHKIRFKNTCTDYDPRNLLPQNGLVQIHVSSGGGEFHPRLDDNPHPPTKPELAFEEWWNTTVVVDTKRNRFSRKDLILALANQDGGAHVDPNLDEKYAELSRKCSIGWIFHGEREEKPIPDLELACVRQITHEALSTFRTMRAAYFS